ncbi:MAG: PEPxxWA-CTERM sorting domain-containing protein [Sphingobium sp.]|nr:PEPxxWA-CTERM sorting domain-containing protein [Sphingobium sp.]
MKKMLCAVLLAGAAVPADAATYIRYSGAGIGSGTTSAQGSGSLLDTGSGKFTFEILAIISDGLNGCYGGPFGCGFGGENVSGSFNHGGSGFGSVKLTFDGPLASWPTSADHFLSGTAGGIFGGLTTFTTWSGIVTSLSVDTFELPTISGRNGVDVSFSFTESYGVPEPATWTLMIGGFAIAGTALRSRTRVRFA